MAVVRDRERWMTVGVAPRQTGFLKGTAAFCDDRVSEGSIWSVLHRECHRLFPDDMFADLFADTGRRSVPPMIVAVVMVLQRLLGLSDREAVEAFCFDARWKYACIPQEPPGDLPGQGWLSATALRPAELHAAKRRGPSRAAGINPKDRSGADDNDLLAQVDEALSTDRSGSRTVESGGLCA